jgi:hypothetical protein
LTDVSGIFLGLKGRPARKAVILTGVCEPIVQKMWKPWYHKPMGLHDLLQGWLNCLHPAQDTLLMSIFPDAYSFFLYVIWKSDQIQGSLLIFVTGLFFMVKGC